MKHLKVLIIASALLASSNAFAHGGEHGEVSVTEVIQAAQTTTKTLTFKDNGMSVGKLDTSWNKVAQGDFELVDATEREYIVKATNAESGEALFFRVSKKGEVLDVKKANSIEKTPWSFTLNGANGNLSF